MRIRRRRVVEGTGPEAPALAPVQVVSTTAVAPPGQTKVIRRRVLQPMDGLELLPVTTKPVPPPGTKRTKALSDFDKAVLDAKSRATRADPQWELAEASVYVGLYASCHESTYGVLPEELREKGLFRSTVARARSVLAKHFNGDTSELIEFIQWMWVREAQKLEWARSKSVENIRRMSAWDQFNPINVTNYRVAMRIKTSNE